jgi:hypothetical protein
MPGIVSSNTTRASPRARRRSSWSIGVMRASSSSIGSVRGSFDRRGAVVLGQVVRDARRRHQGRRRAASRPDACCRPTRLCRRSACVTSSSRRARRRSRRRRPGSGSGACRWRPSGSPTRHQGGESCCRDVRAGPRGLNRVPVLRSVQYDRVGRAIGAAVEQSEADAGTDASGDSTRCCAASGSDDGYAGPPPGRVAVHGAQQLGERRVVDLRRQRTGGLDRAGFPQTRPVHGRAQQQLADSPT